jgi:DNA-binding SARP family transcriptional activator
MHIVSTSGAINLRLRLLGSMALESSEATIALPKSRKVRALLAYLALAPREVTRSRLCELLWDSPSDPRGELRWCLSRLRSVLDADGQSRVVTRGDTIALDLSACAVDVLEIAHALQSGVRNLDQGRLRQLADLFRGELLEDLELDDCHLFSQWLGSERRRLSTAQASVLAAIVARLDPESPEILDYLGRWLAADPFERNAHERLLRALVRQGRLREAEEHLAATIRMFELEGLEWIAIREAWQAARKEERVHHASATERASTPAAIRTAATSLTHASTPDSSNKRASICIMPFLEQTAEGSVRSRLGDGLADDITTRLAKLRLLFVIARGTAFSLGDRNVEPEEAARLLGVDYLASGTVRRRNGRIEVRVELAETKRPHVVWAEDLQCSEAEALTGLDQLGDGLVASIAEEVEAAERNRSVLKPPSSLNAWEAYHRGLWHMYRFNHADNDRAEHFFRLSAELDPTFARAHSGLSFAHFQNAFLHRPQDRVAQMNLALDAAGQSLMADDRDPAAHWAMGRALWLRGEEQGALTEIATSVDLSPNFAMGHYTMGFVHAQSGDPNVAIESAAQSRALSPFDPLLFAMLATHALAHARLGHYEEAATWALKAAARPNAHMHVVAIAAHCLALAGRIDDARSYAARIRTVSPNYGIDDFFTAFRFTDDAKSLFRRAAKRIGFAS